MSKSYFKSARNGLIAMSILLGIYFLILTLVSGWDFTMQQFTQYWPFIVSLAIGFGLQISGYFYLRLRVKEMASKKLLAATGSTSTLAMISCCTHYLVNILPILGVTGAVTFVANYQTDLFWVGIAFNLLGIAYILKKILEFHKHHNL